MKDMMEICCLWASLKQPIMLHVGGGDSFASIEAMFNDGRLGSNMTTKTG